MHGLWIKWFFLFIMVIPKVYPQWPKLPVSTETVESFLDELDTWHGVPYRKGGKDQNGVDNAGLITSVYREVFGIELPYNMDSLWNYSGGIRILAGEEDLLPCDILFIRTSGQTDAVIYIGDEEGDPIVYADLQNGVQSGQLQNIQGRILGALRVVIPAELYRLRGESYLSEPLATNVTRAELLREIRTWIGTPYAWGNNKKQQGADCSGFVTALFQLLFQISLPRTSSNMWSQPVGQKIMRKEDLLPGDVCFFSFNGRVSHVAVYMGKNKQGIGEIAHAKNEREPLGIDPLDKDGFWNQHYIGAKRFVLLREDKKHTDSLSTNTNLSVNSEQLYRSDQPEISHVRIIREDKQLRITWFFRNGIQEQQTALQTKDEVYEKKFNPHFPDARFYRYFYIWKGQRHCGTLIEDLQGQIQLEIDENLATGEVELFNYTLFKHAGSLKEKTVIGKDKPYYQTGEASYYADAFHGRKTASGEVFDMHQLTAAHRTLPFGTRVIVTNLRNGKQVKVRINDRGPFVKGRIIDLSYEAARQLDMIRSGVTDVAIEIAKQ